MKFKKNCAGSFLLCMQPTLKIFFCCMKLDNCYFCCVDLRGVNVKNKKDLSRLTIS